MAKDFIPLSIKIKDVTKKLKDAGFIVVNTNDEKFAILAERKRILCDNHNEFFKKATELIKC
jgi:CDP-diacylglycerol pyrophosphatase